MPELDEERNRKHRLWRHSPHCARNESVTVNILISIERDQEGYTYIYIFIADVGVSLFVSDLEVQELDNFDLFLKLTEEGRREREL